MSDLLLKYLIKTSTKTKLFKENKVAIIFIKLNNTIKLLKLKKITVKLVNIIFFKSILISESFLFIYTRLKRLCT